MKEINDDNSKKILFSLGIILIFVIPLMVLNTLKGGFIEAYFSVIALLFLGPFIVPMTILTWEFDMLPFSMWYMLLFWTLPPIIMGVATEDKEEPDFWKRYTLGYLIMLITTIVVFFIGVLYVLASGTLWSQ